MKPTILDVKINNWVPPGGPWWDSVQADPRAPLIDATIRMVLSWEQYRELVGGTDENRTAEQWGEGFEKDL